jgi:peptide deformylase
MNLVKYPNPILTTPCQEFDFKNPVRDPNDLALDLLSFMIDNNSIGLSANQVGIPYRVLVTRGEPNFAMFNPKIVFKSKTVTLLDEGCLSFPGVVCKIKRSSEIRVRFQMPSGGTTTKVFNGLTAKVIQHEIDHLDGVLFYNRANKFHRDKALKGKR